MRFRQFCEARDHAAIITALRSKTVERGATPEEAKSAAAKADAIEKQHVPVAKTKPLSRRERLAKMSKAERDAYLDAAERDERN